MQRILFLLLIATSSIVPVFPHDVQSGKLNYIDGSVLINDVRVSPSQTPLELRAGQVLNTSQGRAELLLTPGVFLRLASNSSIRADALSPLQVRLSLVNGEALLDVTQLAKNRVGISMDGSLIVPFTMGIYEFDADGHTMRVYDGRASVSGSPPALQIRKGYAVHLDSPVRRPEKFEVTLGDPPYVWSALASEYEAEASYGAALQQRSIAADGWYWNSGMHCWAFVPRSGVVPGPFGWAFAAPSQMSQALILVGPNFHYPAAVDRNNLPRIFPSAQGIHTVNIAHTQRLEPRSHPPSGDFGPGVPALTVPVYH